ncbi:MAG: hypothetical protein LW878_04425, partial [Proteobacteria bacterium]|nr:hypothetical protein [Pseudomonadota bacterium]
MDSHSSENSSEDTHNETTIVTEIDTDPAAPRAADEIDPQTLKVGDKVRLVRVRFPGSNRSFSFFVDNDIYRYGQKVLATNDRGVGVGFVNSFPYEVPFTKDMLPLRKIHRHATAEDQAHDLEVFRDERRLRDIADRLIEKNQLDMQLTQVEITGAGKKAVFSFTAPTRVDFRGLVHEMVGEMKMRIELRQVSVRDRAAAVGGLGPCGRELCCSSFLARYGNVGIKLAKNQDLSLNSSKINGVCGQLKCCLTYEDEVYQEKRRKIPRDNAIVKTKDGVIAKVIRLHVLLEQFETIDMNGVMRRYVSDMWDGIPEERIEIPKYFENGVTDNTATFIGLTELQAKKVREHEESLAQAKREAKGFADSVFENLFGEKTLDWSLPEVTEPENPFARKVAIEEEEEVVYIADEEDLLEEDDDEDDEDGDDDEGDEDIAPAMERPRPQGQPQTQQSTQQSSQQRRPDNRHQQRPPQGSSD